MVSTMLKTQDEIRYAIKEALEVADSIDGFRRNLMEIYCKQQVVSWLVFNILIYEVTELEPF